jgi:hypothetical protein
MLLLHAVSFGGIYGDAAFSSNQCRFFFWSWKLQSVFGLRDLALCSVCFLLRSVGAEFSPGRVAKCLSFFIVASANSLFRNSLPYRRFQISHSNTRPELPEDPASAQKMSCKESAVLFLGSEDCIFFLGYLLMNPVPICAVIHAEDIEISLCDGNSEDERRRRKIGSLRRKAIHALKKRGRRRVDFRFPPAAISIEDVRDAEEERAVAAFRERLNAHGLLPDKHDDYHMMLRSC